MGFPQTAGGERRCTFPRQMPMKSLGLRWLQGWLCGIDADSKGRQPAAEAKSGGVVGPRWRRCFGGCVQGRRSQGLGRLSGRPEDHRTRYVRRAVRRRLALRIPGCWHHARRDDQGARRHEHAIRTTASGRLLQSEPPRVCHQAGEVRLRRGDLLAEYRTRLLARTARTPGDGWAGRAEIRLGTPPTPSSRLWC